MSVITLLCSRGWRARVVLEMVVEVVHEIRFCINHFDWDRQASGCFQIIRDSVFGNITGDVWDDEEEAVEAVPPTTTRKGLRACFTRGW